MSAGLTIRIKKNADGSSSLSCTRANGTTTWQRQLRGHAAFFPRHDLTHYAVETVLRQRYGFYGLIADGWDLTDFGTPWPRGPLPPVANISEMIVGFLDVERASGHLGSADSLNALLADYSRQHGLSAPMLGEDDLGRVRHARGELFARWDALPFGEVLDLEFAIEDHRASAANQRSHLGAARPL